MGGERVSSHQHGVPGQPLDLSPLGRRVFLLLSLTFASSSSNPQPLYGRFSDIFGRKVMLIIALALFVRPSLQPPQPGRLVY